MKEIFGAGGGQPKQKKQKQPQRPTIAQDDLALKSISFAQLQFLLCEGEIEGPAFGNSVVGLERSIFLDDTPIRSASGAISPVPEDLVLSYGRSSVQQTGVPGYSRTTSVEAVDTTCAFNTTVSKSVTGSVTGGAYYARVLLTWQALVQNVLNGSGILGITGDSRTYRTDYVITYTDSNGTVFPAFSGNIAGKFSSTFQRSHFFILQGVGPVWTINVTRTTLDDQTVDAQSGGRLSTSSQFNFSSVSLSLDQKFNNAHSSMLSVGIRADQYSSIPNVSVELLGLKIEVPVNYNQINRTYSGLWNGLFKRVYSNNPAWVLRDLILNDRYGAGQYITADSVSKFELYEIAQYCDELVPSPDGGNEPRFTCNVLLQSSGEAWNVLQQLSSIFRGILFYSSSLAIAAQDRQKDAIFTFSESNTIEQFSEDGKVSQGNFVYIGSARRARHTVVLASYDDPDNDYETRVEYVTDDETFSAFGYRPMDLRLLGVTSRGQALRAANWALLSERLLDDTVKFRTNEIGMALRPGDVIKVADTTKAAVRIGGRIESVNGLSITLDQEPQSAPGGWAGATISWMYNDSLDDPKLQVANIVTQVGNVVTINSTGGNAPVATYPWLIEFPNRTAQLFRILTVEEREGEFEVTALRYRDDIYNAVDFDSPLDQDENFLFKPVSPTAPSNLRAQVIWDNNSAKIDIKWDPPLNSLVLFEYDLSVESYRIQWQAGTEQADGTVEWSGAFRELPRQVDDRETVLLESLSSTDKFRVRAAAVSRFGVQSDWSALVVADDIDVWFPMPDISQLLPGGDSRLVFRNQSSGAQLFTWNFADLAVPPYVSGVRLEVLPNRPLTVREQSAIRPPDADGRYIYGDYPLEEYAVCIFHADTNWNCRVSFLTHVEGLFGNTYALSIVNRLDLVPPPPDRFTVVTETDFNSIAPMRRFSWALPTSEISDLIDGGEPGPPLPPNPLVTANWPLGKVTDIVQFLVRYKAGFDANWDLGVPLFADGIPGDQRYFETEVFDGGEWTVMIRSVDRTGWVSDNQASIIVNFGDAIPTNVVETFEAHVDGWPGQRTNLQVIAGADYSNGFASCEPNLGALNDADITHGGGLSLCTDAPLFNSPSFNPGTAAYDNADVFPRSSFNVDLGGLYQIDPTQDSFYTYPFEVLADEAGILITTLSSGTYQWSLRRIGNDTEAPFYGPANAQGELIYPEPLSNYVYLETNTQIGIDFHPYVAFEKLEAGNYEVGCRIRSVDGVAKTGLLETTIQMDYPDVRITMEDVSINATTQRVFFPTPFPHALKAVNLTLQDPPGTVTTPATGYLRGKDVSYFDVRLLDANGALTSGLVDVIAVGY